MNKINSLEQIKGIELNILKHVHIFCVENNLQYVLAYGTLIGAMRHNGFIPWDDDIDIWMPRKDYEEFEILFPQWGEKRHLYIAGPHNEDHYLPRHMLKVCDSRTILNENTYKDYKQIGLFIDVYPLDNTSNNRFVDRIWTKYVRTYKFRELANNIDTDSDSYRKFNTVKKIVTRILSYGDLKRVNESFISSAGRYKDSESKRATVFFVTFPRVYEKEDIFPARTHQFEDAEFFIPKEADKILRIIYGDYMKLPPKEQQVPMHTSDAYILDDNE